MFRSGKHRPKEEEDSLVPHGMVWHGTPETPPEPSDQPLDPPEPRDQSLDPTVSYAQVMEVMRRRARTPAQQAGQEDGPQREPASGTTRPAPVPWWRIPQPDPEADGSASSSPAAAVTPRLKPSLPLKIEAPTFPWPSTVSAPRPATSEVKNEVMGAKEVRNDVKKEQPAPAASASPTAAVTPHLEPALPLKIEAPIPPSPNTVSSPRPATSEVKNEVPDAKEVRVDVKKEQPAPAASASPTAAVAPRLKWPIPSKVEAPTPPSLSTLFSLSPATSEVEKEVTGAIEGKNDVEEEQLAPAASASPTAAITPHLEPALPLKIEAPAPPWPSTLFSPSPATSEVENEVRGAIEVKNDVEQEELARAQARVWAGAAAAISNFTRSSLVHARRLAAHGNELFSLAAAKAIRERAALEWKPPRVRIVLTGLPLRIKILVTRQHSEWKMRNPDATRDTRLRNAMIMAAACAVVGLIAVSLAPHFAARFLPSHALRSGSTLGAKTVGPSAHASTSTVAQPSKSTVAAGPESPKNRKSHSTPAASRAQGAKPSPQTAEAQPKHRSTKDDDYVAPNTYKYYGNRGSR